MAQGRLQQAGAGKGGVGAQAGSASCAQLLEVGSRTVSTAALASSWTCSSGD